MEEDNNIIFTIKMKSHIYRIKAINEKTEVSLFSQQYKLSDASLKTFRGLKGGFS